MNYEDLGETIKRLEDNAHIPKDEANRDYREYLEWIEAGNTPQEPEAEPAPAIPRIVEMRQARLALLQFGLLDTVDAAITASTPAAKIEWEYALTINRDYALVTTMKAALNLSEAQLDDLFALAATL